MEAKINLDAIYSSSDDVVTREIKGELLIVPLVSGIGDMEDDIFSLNKTGKVIWERIDGKARLKDIVEDISTTFEASEGEIKRDVTGFVEELLKRKILIEVTSPI